MATTVSSTGLDFNQIKNGLKEYFQRQTEFSDYNFEASGLSNLLDVLAYNTHQNALTANFALNESFLTTAQLRSSLVGLANSLGYQVGSRSAAFAVVNLYVNDPSSPSSHTLPAGTSFTTTVNNKSYTFKTREAMTATNDGADNYYFVYDGSTNVPIYEGLTKSKTFLAGPAGENDTYVIPVKNLDLDTVVVSVYESVSSTNRISYTNINDATTINENSKIYAIKETPNGYYELTFGNGSRLSNEYPRAGYRIVVSYDVVAGPLANSARSFTPQSTVSGLTLNVTTVSSASGGAYKEDLESIRKNAPYLYATQNRMVTAEDYSALILRNYSGLIDDIKSWGGEENIPPKYGTVYVSIDFSTTDTSTIDLTKGKIRNLAKDLSVASFDIEFVDPNRTYIEVETFFQFNPNLTSSSQSGIETAVKNTMQSYFNANLGKFDQSFRRSNMLTQIDDTDPSILSSRATIKMQYRFVPTSGIDSYTITLPTSIATPKDDAYIIRSENFYLDGVICYLRNKLGTTDIEVINAGSGAVQLDNVGSYNAAAGTITLSGFSTTLISGTYFRITALPANEATINPLRNNILLYDATASTASAVLTDTV